MGVAHEHGYDLGNTFSSMRPGQEKFLLRTVILFCKYLQQKALQNVFFFKNGLGTFTYSHI